MSNPYASSMDESTAGTTTRLLDDATVQSVFDWNEAVSALRAAYATVQGEARFPARTMARGDAGWLRTLSGIPAGSALMGLKIIAAAPGAGRASYLIPLFDQRTTQLVALLDGHSVTGYRTAATSALAAHVLAAPGPSRVAVLGSGFEATNHVRALAAGQALESVQVYSPRSESRSLFVDRLADIGTLVAAADSAEAAVEKATLVICAARSRDESPTLRGAWLRPGMTVVSIGSTLPEQREVDSEVLSRCDLLVADVLSEVLEDTGDLIAAREAGIDVGPKAVALADVVSGRHPGRTDDDQIVLYKSVGSALQDLAVAGMCVGRAEQLDLGGRLPISFRPIEK